MKQSNVAAIFNAEAYGILEEAAPSKYVSGDADVESMAEIFHERTKLHRATIFGQTTHVLKYLYNPLFIARGAAGFNEFPHLELLPMPEPAPLSASIGEVLRNRSSCREFDGEITMEQVSTILHHAIRVNRRRRSKIAPKVTMGFRPYPSAGNLNCLEVYAFLNSVRGVEPCTVHYSGQEHSFRIIRHHDGNAFAKASAISENTSVRPALVIVIAIVPQRLTGKYGDRGYRFAFLEAGHAAQNLCLVSEALNLGSLACGSFFDDDLAREINIDGVTETIATTILVGPKKAISPKNEEGKK